VPHDRSLGSMDVRVVGDKPGFRLGGGHGATTVARSPDRWKADGECLEVCAVPHVC
jgi:hypothetical protein